MNEVINKSSKKRREWDNDLFAFPFLFIFCFIAIFTNFLAPKENRYFFSHVTANRIKFPNVPKRPSFNQQMLQYPEDTRWIAFSFDCYVNRGMKHEQMNTPLYQKTFLFTWCRWSIRPVFSFMFCFSSGMMLFFIPSKLKMFTFETLMINLIKVTLFMVDV